MLRIKRRFRKYPPITNLQENEAFCEFLAELLDEQYVPSYFISVQLIAFLFSATVIPNLSLGMSLSSPNLAPDELDTFMRRMLVSRISRRVLAQHHIALSLVFAGKSKPWNSSEPNVGIITTGLNVKASIEKCARLLRYQSLDAEGNADTPVEVIVEGDIGMRFSYIREHLECVDFVYRASLRHLSWLRYIVFELLKNVGHTVSLLDL